MGARSGALAAQMRGDGPARGELGRLSHHLASAAAATAALIAAGAIMEAGNG
jgi:hypothetical protein